MRPHAWILFALVGGVHLAVLFRLMRPRHLFAVLGNLVAGDAASDSTQNGVMSCDMPENRAGGGAGEATGRAGILRGGRAKTDSQRESQSDISEFHCHPIR